MKAVLLYKILSIFAGKPQTENEVFIAGTVVLIWISMDVLQFADMVIGWMK